MDTGKRGTIFTDLHRNRHELYKMYISTISTFWRSSRINPIEQLQQVTLELTQCTYDFNDISSINSAISTLIKFKNKQTRNLSRLTMDINDFKREHNAVVATLCGLRQIELIANDMPSEMIDQVMEYENDDSNPDIRAIRSLRIAEIELMKTIYELYHTRFKCESLCKVTKSIVSRLNRHRESIRVQ